MTARSQLAVLLILAGAPALAAQATNPPYLALFPTVAKVKQTMQATDPREAALKQMGALWQLQQIIKQLSGSREFRGLLPDEAKLVQDYNAANYYIGKAIDSAYPGPYGRWQKVSDNTPYGYMRTDVRFGIEGIETYALLPNVVVEAFLQSVGADKARWAARARADTEAMLAARNAGTSAPGARNDAETVAIRRCAESGRSEMQCIMEGLGKSFTGMVNAILPGLKQPAFHGLRMSGDFPGANRLDFTFYSDQVTVACGEMVPAAYDYSIEPTAAGFRITIETTPKPVVVTYRLDGTLQGPGPTDFTGQVQVGTEYGTRTWSDGRTEPISRPVYATRTLRCNVGVLAASGPSAALGSVKTAPAALLGMVFGGGDAGTAKTTPVGARMSGEYGSQLALDLEFQPEGVVLGCREAAILRPYTVQAEGASARIRVANGGSSADFLLGPDGKITGSGTVKVDGRVAGTSSSGGVTYTPRSATCEAGTLAPAGETLSDEEKGAAAARASLGQPTATAPATADLPRASGDKGPAFVQIESGFPKDAAGALPLAGGTMLLLDGDFEAVLREAGVTLGVSETYKSALTKALDAGGAKRDKLLTVLATHTVSFIRLDKDGIGKSPELSIGKTNTFFAEATVGGMKYFWALTGVAKGGWTKVVLTAGNALR